MKIGHRGDMRAKIPRVATVADYRRTAKCRQQSIWTVLSWVTPPQLVTPRFFDADATVGFFKRGPAKRAPRRTHQIGQKAIREFESRSCLEPLVECTSISPPVWEAGKSAWTTPRFPVAVRERCGNKDRRGGLEPPKFFCPNFDGLPLHVRDLPTVSLHQDPSWSEENTMRCLIGLDPNSGGGSRSRLSSVHRDVFLPVLRHGVICWLRARSATRNMGGRIWGVAGWQIASRNLPTTCRIIPGI